MKEATVKKAVSKPISLKAHKANRAKKIHEYIGDCLAASEKIDKAFLKELGDIA
jgi:hypothetical protein